MAGFGLIMKTKTKKQARKKVHHIYRSFNPYGIEYMDQLTEEQKITPVYMSDGLSIYPNGKMIEW